MNLKAGFSKYRLLWAARTCIDLVIVACSFYIAFTLIAIDRKYTFIPGLFEKTLGFTAVSAVCFAILSVGRGSWRHVSIPDLITVVKASALSIMIFLVATFFVSRGQNIHRTGLLLTFIFMVVGVSGVRMAYRLAIENSWIEMFGIRPIKGRRRVLLYGLTDGAEGYIRMLRRLPNAEVAVVGIIDDKQINRTQSVQGIRVLGSLSDLDNILKRQNDARKPIEEVIVTEHALTRQRLSEIVEAVTARHIKVSRIANPTETSSVDVSGVLEPKPIELGDLLGRAEVKADVQGVARLVQDRVVLVTGAGGSIGSELCRQIAMVSPLKLIITDASEYHLYLLDNELRLKHPNLDIITRILNVREAARVRSLFATHSPEVVFHAAALKHVPMVEENAIEGVKTNVLGTRNVADAAVEFKASTFVVISTDKAVNPTNVMGASKRAAEAYCQALDIRSDATRFKTVRFGNVLGSSGSVVPLFQSQIAVGGPVTVTHPHIVRFFMTIPEAVRLVLQASAHRLLNENERGKIMVLDMGKPVRIVDLAERMIQLAGYRPGIDIEIKFTGLRPGEKLYEELFDPSEIQDSKTDEGYFIASPRIIDAALLQRTLVELDVAALREDRERTIELLSHIVPEYQRGKQLAYTKPPVYKPAAAAEDWR